MTKPQDEITLIRAGNFSRLTKLVADAELVWCDTCHDHVMPDDGECSCGAVLDHDAYEAAGRDNLDPFLARDLWLDQPAPMRRDPRNYE